MEEGGLGGGGGGGGGEREREIGQSNPLPFSVYKLWCTVCILTSSIHNKH